MSGSKAPPVRGYVVKEPRSFLHRLASVTRQPAEIDTPLPILLRRVFLIVLSCALVFGLVSYFLITEETTVTIETQDVNSECPLTVPPQTVREVDVRSYWTFTVQSATDITSYSQCTELFTLDRNSSSVASTHHVTLCRRGVGLDLTHIECVVDVITSWSLGAQNYTFKHVFREFEFLKTSCPAFPKSCTNVQEINRTESASTVCFRQSDLTEQCSSLYSEPIVTSTDICNILFDANVPHLCEITVGNPWTEIVSIVVNSTATTFVVVLTASYFIWPWTLAQAVQMATQKYKEAEVEDAQNRPRGDEGTGSIDQELAQKQPRRPRHSRRGLQRTERFHVAAGGLVEYLTRVQTTRVGPSAPFYTHPPLSADSAEYSDPETEIRIVD